MSDAWIDWLVDALAFALAWLTLTGVLRVFGFELDLRARRRR